MEIAHYMLYMSGTSKPFSSQHLSHWIVETIEFTNTSMGLYSPMGLRAHSMRGMASSWALFKGISIGDMCATASWASPLFFHILLSGCHYAYYGSCSC